MTKDKPKIKPIAIEEEPFWKWWLAPWQEYPEDDDVTPPEDKKLTVVPVEENLYDKYIELLNAGELLPGTTFELFEKLHRDLDVDIISKIKKRVIDKKRIEGLASLLNLRAMRS